MVGGWIILITYVFLLSSIMGLLGGISAFLKMFLPGFTWLISLWLMGFTWLIGLWLMTQDTLRD